MYCAISSVRMRDRENTMVFTPAFSRRVATRWLSSTTLRRMPCTASTIGGLYSTKCRSPDGEPLSSISSTSSSRIFPASSFGLPMVAEQQMNTGFDP